MENPEKVLQESLDRAEVEHKLREKANEKIEDFVNYCMSDLGMNRFDAYLAVEDILIRTMNQKKEMVEAQENRP